MTNVVHSDDESSTHSQLTIVNPKALYNPVPNGYSHVVMSNQKSRLAYISGQGGEQSNGTLSPVFENQVLQAYKNLNFALESIDAKPQDVMKITTYVVEYDMQKLGIMTEQVVALFGEKLPAQTLVPVPRLALDGMLFEVDAVVSLE